MEQQNKKPNGFQWFTLGFCTATLIVEILTLLLK